MLLLHGISEDDLETELEEKLLEVDRMRSFDDGVNSVLVASAADEIMSLRNQIDTQASQIDHMKQRSVFYRICSLLFTMDSNVHRACTRHARDPVWTTI